VIGLDANVLIRFLVDDEPEQAARARQLMVSLTSENPGYVSLISLIETLWVLKHHYHSPREAVVDAVDSLLDAASLKIQCSDEVRAAVVLSRRHGVDLPDCLVAMLGAGAGCDHTVTFDRRAVRLPDMRQL